MIKRYSLLTLTADATRRETDRLRRLGARTYLTKPVTMHRLLGVIDDHAQAQRIVRPTVESAP